MTAIAPVTSSHRKYRLPCLVMPPSRSLPPVVCCFGTNPIQAARLRPDPNAFQSPISATKAVATIGPMPGISSSRRLASQERCQARMLFWMDPSLDGPELGTDGAVPALGGHRPRPAVGSAPDRAARRQVEHRERARAGDDRDGLPPACTRAQLAPTASSTLPPRSPWATASLLADKG